MDTPHLRDERELANDPEYLVHCRLMRRKPPVYEPGDRVRDKSQPSKCGTVIGNPPAGVFVQWDSGEIVRPEILEPLPPEED